MVNAMRLSTSLGIVAVHVALFALLAVGFGVEPWPWLLMGAPASALIVTALIIRSSRRDERASTPTPMQRSLGKVWPYWQTLVVTLAVYASCALITAAIAGPSTGAIVSALMLVSMLGLLTTERISRTHANG